MPIPRRLLAADASPPPEPPSEVDSDVVVILAALLCALICVVGLALVARCAWLRGLSTRRPSPPAPHNRGLKKKVLRSIPKLTFSTSVSLQAKLPADCPICLSDFTDGEEIRILPQCGHGFHVRCVDTWLRAHSSCPSCRQNLVATATATAASTSITAGSRCQMCGARSGSVESSAGGAVAEEEGGAKARQDGDANRFLP